MIYLFNIMFKKELIRGGVKVITYRQLLEDSNAFGPGETLDGVVGTLSLSVGDDKDYSISSLFAKNRAQLVGNNLAVVSKNVFPLKIFFNHADDVTSLRIDVCNDNGFNYSSDGRLLHVKDSMDLDLADVDSFAALVPKDDCVIRDSDSEITVHSGQLAFVPAANKSVTICGNSDVIVVISPLEYKSESAGNRGNL